MVTVKEEVLNWLLNSEHYVEYNTRTEFIKIKSEEVTKSKLRMLDDQRIKIILNELKQWPGYPLKRHNDANHLLHKLSFIADIGLRKDDLDISEIINLILKNRSPEGIFEVIANIPTHFGGSGVDENVWMLCDAPTILYSLQKLGLKSNNQVDSALNYFVNLKKENGWHCTASPKVGKFRGPGRKGDPCPYANLITLKALIQHPKWKNDKICNEGAEILLSLWEQRKELKPYLFAMGTDFKKLKASMIWYDIIHVTDVISQLPDFHKDERFLEMITILKAKEDVNGFYSAESVWKAFKEWDFGQKKEPSPWITFLVYRILNRIK